MDATIRMLERRVAADPADGMAVARLARALARSGRVEAARGVAYQRFRARRIDAEAIALVLELAQGIVEGAASPVPPQANVNYVVGRAGRRSHGLPEVVPTLAFAGVPGAGAQENVLALAELFGATSAVNVVRSDDEVIVDVAARLDEPWIVARTCVVRSLRLVSIPVAPHLVKLRRQLLTAASGLAFVVDVRGETTPGWNEPAWRAIARDFRWAHGFGLDEIPLAVQYVEPVPLAWHRAFAAALGLKNVPRVSAWIDTSAAVPDPPAARFSQKGDARVVAHEGLIETLALLLDGVAAGVRGVAAPRPRSSTPVVGTRRPAARS